MIVYIESNFVLELARYQEQYENCNKILSICEIDDVRLVIPAYCLAEPYETLIRSENKRRLLSKELDTELKQLSRSKPYKEKIEELHEVTSILIKSGEEERQVLNKTFKKLLNIAETISLGSEILQLSIKYWNRFSSPQDAIVYASVYSHLSLKRNITNCFITKNLKDFNNPDIEEELKQFNCKLLFSFENGYNYIESKIH